MSTSRLIRYSACLATPFLLIHCGDSKVPTVAGATGGDSSMDASSGGADVTLTGGANSTGSTHSSTGAVGAGGGTSSGGNAPGGGASTGATSFGGGTSTGGRSPGGGTSTGGRSPGGGTSTGGTPPGGGTSTGGTSPGGGTSTGGRSPGGGTSTGGTGPTGGTSPGGGTSTGGADPSGGAAPTGGVPSVDKNGVGLAKPGDKKSNSNDYLNLGDFRLLANKWGSDELGCNDTSLDVHVNTDSSVGWTMSRGVCGGKSTPKDTAHPDYPEIEFGVHPFGAGSDLATSPDFSSTDMMPIQIKDVQSAVLKIDNLNITLTNSSAWNLNFEMWLSQGDPLQPNPGVYAELMAWWGWNNNWACGEPSADGVSPPTPYNQSVTSSGKTYDLCHQSDSWADGKWRYFQFRAGGSATSYNGEFDVKAFLDYLVNTRGYSRDLWISRFEIGTEIDDNTSVTVSVKNLTCTINGTSRSFTLGQ
jgi:hypothetical protein